MMEVKMMLLEQIKPYPYNNKDHSKNVKHIVESIERYGFRNPILIDKDNVIIAGHGRWLAAKEIGMLDVPTIQHSDLSEEQVKELRALDNLIGEMADYDLNNLLVDFAKSQDERLVRVIKANVVGFKLDSEKQKEGQEDIVPVVLKADVVKHGDVIEIGQHRIMCGDSTKMEDVAILMNGVKADCVWTDFPYNVNYKGRAQKTSQGIKNDNMDKDKFLWFLTDAFACMREYSKKGAGLYVFHNHKEQATFEQALLENNFDIKQQIIWNKPTLGLGAGDYRPKHEIFFYCAHKGEKPQFYGDRTNATVVDPFKDMSEKQMLDMFKIAKQAEKEGKTTIWSIKRDKVNEYEHPTQKPVALCQPAIINSSKADDVILDLFHGSGTLLITCEKHGRICYAMELDPIYVETAISRYVYYTEKEEVTINGVKKDRSQFKSEAANNVSDN